MPKNVGGSALHVLGNTLTDGVLDKFCKGSVKRDNSLTFLGLVPWGNSDTNKELKKEWGHFRDLGIRKYIKNSAQARVPKTTTETKSLHCSTVKKQCRNLSSELSLSLSATHLDLSLLSQEQVLRHRHYI